MANAALPDGRVDHVLTGRVIQIDRDLSLEHEGQVDHRGGNRGRKQDPHVRIVAQQLRQEPAKHRRTAPWPGRTSGCAGSVAKGRPPPVPPGRAEKRVARAISTPPGSGPRGRKPRVVTEPEAVITAPRPCAPMLIGAHSAHNCNSTSRIHLGSPARELNYFT